MALGADETPVTAHPYDPMPGAGTHKCRRCWKRDDAPAHVRWRELDALRRGEHVEVGE